MVLIQDSFARCRAIWNLGVWFRLLGLYLRRFASSWVISRELQGLIWPPCSVHKAPFFIIHVTQIQVTLCWLPTKNDIVWPFWKIAQLNYICWISYFRFWCFLLVLYLKDLMYKMGTSASLNGWVFRAFSIWVRIVANVRHLFSFVFWFVHMFPLAIQTVLHIITSSTHMLSHCRRFRPQRKQNIFEHLYMLPF